MRKKIKVSIRKLACAFTAHARINKSCASVSACLCANDPVRNTGSVLPTKSPRAFTTTCVYTQPDLCIHAPLVLHGLCVLMCVLVYVCECVSVCMCALVCLIVCLFVCLFVWLFVRVCVCVRGCACVDVGLLLCACDVRVCVRARPVTSKEV